VRGPKNGLQHPKLTFSLPKKIKKIFELKRNQKNNSSEKRMPKRPENG
jgi:hypothetical protein